MDMENLMRMMASRAATGKVMADAQKHIDEMKRLVDTFAFTAEELPTPKPEASRAFTVKAGPYIINVMQANVMDPAHPELDQGVICRGMAVEARTGLIMVIPPEVADFVYHKVAAGRN